MGKRLQTGNGGQAKAHNVSFIILPRLFLAASLPNKEGEKMKMNPPRKKEKRADYSLEGKLYYG